MRLIDADALMNDAVIHRSATTNESCIPVDAVDDAPTIEERKTGKWIDDNCSVCGQYVYHGDARNYCPNCGAKMRGDKNDG